MDVPSELEFERLDDAEKYHRAVPGYMRRLRDVYEAVYERFGDAGLDLIREVSTQYGAEIAANVKKRADLKGVGQVGKYLLKVFDMVSDDWEVREFSPDRLVIGVRRCPYPFSRDQICKAHTCMEQSLVAGLDDTLEYRIGRSIPQGDPYCEHILTRKAGTP
ncbi:MAG: hypothetical protein PVF33_13395 [Candidatus Latescibacterota bacterium]|jgi:hypothetical protein